MEAQYNNSGSTCYHSDTWTPQHYTGSALNYSYVSGNANGIGEGRGFTSDSSYYYNNQNQNACYSSNSNIQNSNNSSYNTATAYPASVLNSPGFQTEDGSISTSALNPSLNISPIVSNMEFGHGLEISSGSGGSRSDSSFDEADQNLFLFDEMDTDDLNSGKLNHRSVEVSFSEHVVTARGGKNYRDQSCRVPRDQQLFLMAL